ncbi:MAG: nicotinate (nicotinamide) nucleotide adenylyltransferase, partial [Pseudomonadota bacterium]
ASSYPALYPKKLVNIAIFGGSFNPAHLGHIYISKETLKRFPVNEIWWLLTPHNPFKSQNDLLPLQLRYQHADKLIKENNLLNKIKLIDFESAYNNPCYFYKTLNHLTKIMPNVNFSMIMGADNLVTLHKWENYQQIIQKVDLIVFDRGNFKYPALASKAYNFSKHNIKTKKIYYMHIKKYNISATDIRKKGAPQSLIL